MAELTGSDVLASIAPEVANMFRLSPVLRMMFLSVKQAGVFPEVAGYLARIDIGRATRSLVCPAGGGLGSSFLTTRTTVMRNIRVTSAIGSCWTLSAKMLVHCSAPSARITYRIHGSPS